MKMMQYTIRSVPKQLDTFLRRQARLSGRSLNQVVLDYMSQATRLDMRSQAVEDDFSWLIDAGILDKKSLAALRDHKQDDLDTQVL